MKTIKQFSILLIMLISSVWAQMYWNGQSVATSDNVDALSLNPAGLAITRGEQSAFQILSPKDEHQDPTYFLGSRMNSFGYTLYGSDDIYWNLAFAGDLGDDLYFGYKYDSHKIHTLGFLFRPIPFLSLGVTGNMDKNVELVTSRMGVAVRPFGHRFTIGADLATSMWDQVEDFESFKSKSDLLAFVEIQPMDGIFISGLMDENGDDFRFNLGFDFGKGGVNVGASDFGGSEATEYGFYSHTQLLETILKRTNKKADNYVRMEMATIMIEERPYNPPFNFNLNLNPFQPSFHGTQLRTWIEKLDGLTEDPEIDGLIIDYRYIGGGFGKMLEVRNALQRFKDSGKKIIVYAKSISNMGTYLLSMADEIYLAPLGEVDLRGINLELNFYKGLMDKLDVVGEFEQISPYKTAPDPFMREDMSPEMRENYSEVFDDLYAEFVSGIAAGHGWSREETQNIIDGGPYMSKEAVKLGLATGLMFPDEFDDYVDDINGGEINVQEWHKIDADEEYVHAWKDKDIPQIAIVYAVGGITSGRSNPGPGGSTIMGDETIMEALKSARENEDVEAIVFRIDSGGGSALASDMILREINNTTTHDSSNVKPFIASMSDVAGSGGYWIACQADKIVAYPTTITGSIGVVSGRINFSGLLEKLGISTDRIKYGKHSDFYSGNKQWTAEEKAIVRRGIIDVYEQFKVKVADGRPGLEVDDLDPIALGRIWSGNQAQELLLIDEVGGLTKAIDEAKSAAGIPADQEVEIVEYPRQPNRFSFLNSFNMSASTNLYIPEEILEQLAILNIIPILEDDEIQLIMPYTISID